MANQVFISKNDSEVSGLRDFINQNGGKLISHSFLDFEPTEFEIEQSYDILFFGSPRAVIFFKANSSIPTNKPIACIGSKTAELLEEIGYQVSFKGENSGDPKSVAKKFKEWCKGRKVIFPSSDISLRSISSAFPEEQKIEVAVYKTIIKPHSIPFCSTYVFSSPSNVNGFFLKNTLDDNVKVIAWGKSTAAKLAEHYEGPVTILQESSIESLIQILSK